MTPFIRCENNCTDTYLPAFMVDLIGNYGSVKIKGAGLYCKDTGFEKLSAGLSARFYCFGSVSTNIVHFLMRYSWQQLINFFLLKIKWVLLAVCSFQLYLFMAYMKML
jgi:hypothetical protein